MKKLIVLFALTWISVSSFGNGGPSYPNLNEIAFDSEGNWTIEIRWGGWNKSTPPDDTLILTTSAGESMVISDCYSAGGYLVISDTCLDNPLQINREGDFIKLTWIWEYYYHESSVVFGNYQGSYLYPLENGQSYSWQYYSNMGWGYGSTFAVDNSPTIGEHNDTDGTMCTLTGKVYSPDGIAYTQGEFELESFLTIHINPDGSFSENTFARMYKFDQINLSLPPNVQVTYSIIQVELSPQPDMVYEVDFETIEVLEVAEKEEIEKDDANRLVVSPNPFTNKITFYVRPDILELTGQNRIVIIDQQGILRKEIILDKNQNRYEWMPESHLSAGVYIYHLINNNRPVVSGKMIKI